MQTEQKSISVPGRAVTDTAASGGSSMFPNGGPDGGDGGRGGDLIFEVDEGLNTLSDTGIAESMQPAAGEPGGKRRCHGKDGKDLISMFRRNCHQRGRIRKSDRRYVGREQKTGCPQRRKRRLGNQHFATATMQVPKYAQPGQPARELEVSLELKVIADVGLIGFPNVGKSTLLSRVTNAEPKIANYHFTTLTPNLGVVDLEGAKGL